MMRILPTLAAGIAVACASLSASGLFSVGSDLSQAVLVKGLIVESVEAGSTGEKAGIEVEDRLLEYDGKPLTSPAKLEALEENTFGPDSVELRLRRGDETLSLQVPLRPLGVKVRPDLSPEVLALYSEGSSLLESGVVDEAIAKWTEAADLAEREVDKTSAAWLYRRVAGVSFDQRNWEKALKSNKHALELLSDSGDMAAVSDVLSSLGRCSRNLNDFEAAKEWYDKACEASESAGYELWLADMLTSVGIIADMRGDPRAVESYFLRALEIRERLAPDSLALAASLNNLGIAARGRGNLQAAEEYYERSLEIKERLAPNSLGVAASLNNLGIIADMRGDPGAAESYFLLTLEIRERLAPNSLAVAASLNNLGIAAGGRGNLQAAENYYARALEIKERLAPGSLDVAMSLNNLGNVASNRGDLQGAEEYYSRALAIRERLAPNSLAVAASLFSLGIVAADRGNFQAAEEYYRRALAIQERLTPDSFDVADTYNNMGIVAYDLGDLQAAEEYYKRALATYERLAPDSLDVAASLNNLGNVAWARGDLQAAAEYDKRAMAVYERVAPDSLHVAASLHNLGVIAGSRGNLEAEEEYHKRALAIKERLAPDSLDVASTLSSLGHVAWESGDLQAAEEYERRALAIYERLAPDSLDVADSLKNLGVVAYGTDNFADAVQYYSQAIEIIESQRQQIRSAEARSLLLGSKFTAYALLVRAHVALADGTAAFDLVERSRARGLLDEISERGLDFAADAPQELVEEQDEIDARRASTYSMLAKLAGGAGSPEAEDLRAEILRLGVQQRELDAEFRRQSPKYASVQYPQPLDLEGSQAALDEGTLLLTYFVDKEETYLFTLLGGEKPRKEREFGLKLYRLNVGAEELQQLVTDFRYAIVALGAVVQKGKGLYDLLVRPAESEIEKAERVLVCPDGPLHNLPFAALVANVKDASTSKSSQSETARGGWRSGQRRSEFAGVGALADKEDPRALANARFFGETKPLHTIVSMTVYAETRLQWEESPKEYEYELLAFGDPAYGEHSNGQEAEADENFRTRRSQLRQQELSRLPFTLLEVESIAALFGDAAVVRLGTKATETEAKKLSAKARIVHFASHGLLDDEDPLASGIALLASDDDDGILQAWEIFESFRLNADLVVLSACETALGETTKNEGVVGLTRALQYAGARSIVVSLWSVQDDSTSDLMVAFYTELLKGAAKDVALQRAMASVREDATWRHPFHWAPFMLVGDWR